MYKAGVQKHNHAVMLCGQKVYVHNQKVYIYLMREFPNGMKSEVCGCFRLIFKKKKGHGRLIVTAMLVLPFSLSKFRHNLETDSPTKRSGLVDCFVNEILGFAGEKHQQPPGNTGLCMCV